MREVCCFREGQLIDVKPEIGVNQTDSIEKQKLLSNIIPYREEELHLYDNSIT